MEDLPLEIVVIHFSTKFSKGRSTGIHKFSYIYIVQLSVYMFQNVCSWSEQKTICKQRYSANTYNTTLYNFYLSNVHQLCYLDLQSKCN
jgi:hypothetical protein